MKLIHVLLIQLYNNIRDICATWSLKSVFRYMYLLHVITGWANLYLIHVYYKCSF